MQNVTASLKKLRASLRLLQLLQGAFRPESNASDGTRNYGSYLELERIARGLVVVTNNTD